MVPGEKKNCLDLIQTTYQNHKADDSVEIIVVLMGGDGGLMRAMSELRPVADLSKIIFVALPFGSGNDLAQETNWGAQFD